MIASDDDTCGACRFFIREVEDGGECRRSPPAVAADEEDCLISVFPVVPACWWWGEFQRRTS